MKRAPRAWVLNLEAENELEAGPRFTPTRHLRALVRHQRAPLLASLLAPGDLLLTEDELAHRGPGWAAGLSGLAWSPTPRALALLAAAGARPLTSPALETLRRVNARPFAVDVRAPLVRESFEKRVATTLEETLALLARPAPEGWLVRRTFGAAGRGRRRLQAGSPSSPDRAWLAAGLRRGALVVEPWVSVTREYTRSGWVHPTGEVVIAPPCFQATTREGAWTRTEPARRNEVSSADDERLEEAAAAAGLALATAGYHGPFGIDAFRHRPAGGASGGDVLNPLSEINARFTMDWATGMETGRPGARLDELTEPLA